MELIIDFYKSLDTLNLIIFWGIIIVIILLLIFSSILHNKNKKLKRMVEKSNINKEELPIKKEEQKKEYPSEEENELKNDDDTIPLISEENQKQNNIEKTIETEKKFIVEEHIMEYNKDNSKMNDNLQQEESNNYKATPKKEIEIPTKPYQRNVLREMSLSQTSPIGITKPIKKENRNVEMAKDLQNSLNNQQELLSEVKTPSRDEEIKKELTKIESSSPRKTEIIENTYRTKEISEEIKKESSNYIPTRTNNQNYSESLYSEHIKREPKPYEEKSRATNEDVRREASITTKVNTINQDYISSPIRELLNSAPQITRENSSKSSSEKYLEEVSKKLAEAEIPDEIERTNYELEQEENAIISYKELMEKKDSIQTIDEEEAVISIEELMNRSNQQQEQVEITEETTKLYNITEEEENDEFLKQLKQFRNDLY